MTIAAGDRRRTWVLGTSGLAAAKNRPVRQYLSGGQVGEAVLAVTGGDANVLGIAAGGKATAGYAFPVGDSRGDEFLASVATTVGTGTLLRCGAGGTLRDAGATSGNKYIARSIEGRDNSGDCWCRFEPGEVD